ncbi:endoglucanase-4 [Magnaporthiopsis poae ATCC 64411]|uniref:lytic cellulose monooxygenase (C4-dehydrogenating) n=1 Tax=Magnaporthiopsis poae (strain ATCC 64411 / 73-15) TaxID=644358 RepID=A0A0C4E9A2_MAGP6|nr:endoglucanase-4 [Magnaporthiopsis poae ATCC 64411]
MMLFPTAASWSLLVGQALAHSHIAYIIVNGRMFRGYDAKSGDIPADIANPPAQVVKKTDLRFFKIDDSAPVLLGPTSDTGDGGPPPPGRWVSDVLIANNNSWQIQVPQDLAPGPYVLRHELIALHFAAKINGAQNYPQCINLWVKESRSSNSTKSWGPGAVGYGQGVSPMAMYGPQDPGILVDVNQPLPAYQIPGPTLVSGAEPIPATAQATSLPTAWGTPVSVVSGSMTIALPVTEPFVPRSPPS